MALTKTQLELVEFMLSHPMMSDVQTAKQLGLNNKTVGKWRKLPEFQEELKRRLSEQWQDAEKIAQSTMIDLAIKGNFKASKYILDSLGYAPAQRIEADVNADIDIIIEE